MNASQLIKLAILRQAHEWFDGVILPESINGEAIDAAWDENDDGDYQDAKNEFRCSGTPTNITAPSSRHYEADSVYAEIEGRHVGWTHWHGGGKFGEPEAIDWIDSAYFLSVKSQRTVVKYEFEVLGGEQE